MELQSFPKSMVCKTNHVMLIIIIVFSGFETAEIPQHLLIIQVYPDTTSFDRIERDTKNTLETQISLIGGTMGLFTGDVYSINL